MANRGWCPRGVRLVHTSGAICIYSMILFTSFTVFHMMTELYAGLALVMQEFQILPRLGPILLRTESAFQSLV